MQAFKIEKQKKKKLGVVLCCVEQKVQIREP